MQPQSPNPDFNFMFNAPQPKRRLLPSLNLPKPAKIILGIVAGLFVLIILLSALSGRKNSSNQPFINVLSRQQEILRVTQLAQQQLQDPGAQALAATVTSSISSGQTQLINYLGKNGTKVNTNGLTGYLNKNTDTQLQTASQNNNLDSAYESYLKDSLTTYENELQTAYKSAGPNGKKLLSDAFDSAKTLLSSPPLKS